MYFNLINSMKRRLILELQDSFAQHPVFQKITPFIQNRYSFRERPQMGIVFKGSSANKIQFAANNYLGGVESHVMLANVGAPVFPLEWVREDEASIRGSGGVMPTPPGVYYLEILSAPSDAQSEGQFILDPLLTVSDEPVLRFESGIESEGQLSQLPLPGTLRLWENNKFLLVEGTHYSVDYQTGAITFLDRTNPGATVTADYRYEIPSVGPFPWKWNQANFTTLPGVVLAFGKRGKVGDKVAIVVYEDRVMTADAYGGKFEISFDVDVITRDAAQTEEIADLVWMYLYTQKRPRLAYEGIDIVEVSIGGESEEVVDETGDELSYNASISIQVQSDWEVHVPLPFTISKVTPTTAAMDHTAGAIGSTITGDLRNNLVFSTAAVIKDRNNSFERIR